MDDLVVAAQARTHEREHPLAAEEWLASRVLECITDPRVVCRFALINKNFSAASASDLVWQKLLPPPAILDALLAHVMNYNPLSKKHLYFDLCNPITYDNGLKKFWLDRATGGECHMISAKALSIVWGNSPQYWQWEPYRGSMFSEVAHLRSVCWFDVSGTFQHLFRPGKHMISFQLQLHSDNGWQGVPVKLCVQNTTYAHPPQESQVFFDSPPFKLIHNIDPYPHVWVECDVGEFFVEDDNANRPIEVRFAMTEVEVGHWKQGLFLDGVIIRPSYVIDHIADRAIN